MITLVLDMTIKRIREKAYQLLEDRCASPNVGEYVRRLNQYGAIEKYFATRHYPNYYNTL